MADDAAWMGVALALGRRGLGRTWSSPSVGCVIIRDGIVVGRGWTQPGGRPHAEIEALNRAGEAARGATAYVTLEPCAHHGRAGPCCDALVAAGIARVVVACTDPDPRTNGDGIARMRAAGIEVTEGVRASEAREVNAGFFLRIEQGRPLVTVKLAVSLDGRIAAHTGSSRWITGEASRAYAHRLRAESDAIMVGAGTAATDDPQLTCRLPGMAVRSPLRIAADSRLRIPLTHHLVSGAKTQPTLFLTLDGSSPRAQALRECGVDLMVLPPGPEGGLDMAEGMRMLGERGITRLMVEGGGRLVASLMRAGLVDRLICCRAPIVIGGDGIPGIAALGIDSPDQAPRLVRVACMPVGDDLMETYRVER